MYELKVDPEDFIVREKIDIPLTKEQTQKHRFAIFKLTKTKLSTMDAVYKIAKKFLIPAKKIGINGLKDKHGITSQYISFDTYSPAMSDIEIDERIELEFVGFAKKPLGLGDLSGNEFELKIKNIENKEKLIQRLNEVTKICKEDGFVYYPNYYDTQRFSRKNVSQAINILKRDFETFTKELIDLTGDVEDLKTSDFRDYEKEVVRELKKAKKDYLRAIQKINNKMLKIYLHAIQSYIFNHIVNIILSENFDCNSMIIKLEKNIELDLSFPKSKMEKNFDVPLMGYDPHLVSDFLKDLPFDDETKKSITDWIENFFKEYKINQRSFVLTEIPQVSPEGAMRPALATATNVEWTQEGDNIKLKFDLEKGSYATMFVKFISA